MDERSLSVVYVVSKDVAPLRQLFGGHGGRHPLRSV